MFNVVSLCLIPPNRITRTFFDPRPHRPAKSSQTYDTQPSNDTLPAICYRELLANFKYPDCASELSRKNGVNVRIAEGADTEAVYQIQKNSPADGSVGQGYSTIKALVENRQILIAEAIISGQTEKAGAVFFHCSDDPLNYDYITQPENHNLRSKNLYDFWIVVDREKRASDDQTSVAKTLIAASKHLAGQLNKEAVIAYSRHSRPHDNQALGANVGATRKL